MSVCGIFDRGMASVELHQIRCTVTRSEDKTEELLDGLGTKECTSGADNDGLRPAREKLVGID